MDGKGKQKQSNDIRPSNQLFIVLSGNTASGAMGHMVGKKRRLLGNSLTRTGSPGQTVPALVSIP